LAAFGPLSAGSSFAALVDIRFVVRTSPSGSDTAASLPSSVTAAKTGTTLYVEVWAQTTHANGLTSVSADITYTVPLGSVQSITHTALFPLVPSGSIDNGAGFINDLSGSHLGSCSDAVAVAPNWGRVAVIQMTTSGVGTLTLQGGQTGSAVYGVAICGVGDIVPQLRDLLRRAGYERRTVQYEKW